MHAIQFMTSQVIPFSCVRLNLECVERIRCHWLTGLGCKRPVLSKFISMQDLENNNWIILEFIWNNSDTFRELIHNNNTHFLSEFISNNTETFREVLLHKTPFVTVYIKQYWHFSNKQTILKTFFWVHVTQYIFR